MCACFACFVHVEGLPGRHNSLGVYFLRSKRPCTLTSRGGKTILLFEGGWTHFWRFLLMGSQLWSFSLCCCHCFITLIISTLFNATIYFTELRDFNFFWGFLFYDYIWNWSFIGCCGGRVMHTWLGVMVDFWRPLVGLGHTERWLAIAWLWLWSH